MRIYIYWLMARADLLSERICNFFQLLFSSLFLLLNDVADELPAMVEVEPPNVRKMLKITLLLTMESY